MVEGTYFCGRSRVLGKWGGEKKGRVKNWEMGRWGEERAEGERQGGCNVVWLT
jgi:hypothetical protein